MRNVKIGAPGFILMDDMRKDMPGTLQKIGKMGYDGIELLGFFGHSAGKIRQWCQNAGLIPYSCFVRLEELVQEKEPIQLNDFEKSLVMPGATVEEKLQYVKEIGCEYAGLLLPDHMPEIRTAVMLDRLSPVFRKAGLKLQYHNHAQEYLHRVGGQYRMEYILDQTDPQVLFEPDLGWMEIGGCRCGEQIRKYANRMEIIHLKDYYREAFDVTKEHRFRPTGYGVMDWANILPLCETLVKPQWYTVDHDKAYDRDLFEELEISLRFVRNALFYC